MFYRVTYRVSLFRCPFWFVAGAEELTSSAKLKVTPTREPLFTRKLDVLEVIEGRTARFDCKVSGSPAPSVTWMHFGEPSSVRKTWKVVGLIPAPCIEMFLSKA